MHGAAAVQLLPEEPAVGADREELREGFVRAEQGELPLQGSLSERFEPARRDREAPSVVFDQDDVPLGWAAHEQRVPVNVPRNPNAERGGDGGQDVGVPGGPEHDAPSRLVRQLHEQRHVRDVLEVRGRKGAALLAGPEADAVVGGDHQQRAVVEPGRTQPRDDAFEDGVRVARAAAGGAASTGRQRPGCRSTLRRIPSPAQPAPSRARPREGISRGCAGGGSGRTRGWAAAAAVASPGRRAMLPGSSWPLASRRKLSQPSAIEGIPPARLGGSNSWRYTTPVSSRGATLAAERALEIWAELHRAQMGFLVHDVEAGASRRAA